MVCGTRIAAAVRRRDDAVRHLRRLLNEHRVQLGVRATGQKIYYNLTITGLSVAVAFMIGGIETIGVVSSELHLHGWLGDTIANFDLNTAGLKIAALFSTVWAIAIAVWRLTQIDTRWTANVSHPDDMPPRGQMQLCAAAHNCLYVQHPVMFSAASGRGFPVLSAI